ncbi:DUF2496 domain-containing protein [Rosenbergiella australiborealis]|uniref:DUF2496 domain-containing protein n=1 Tax=Rosenbergiella australiborealis TaxID=1544696 RepID=A0ABS5T6W7_9GAMM|nr:DUF2496 domain-containing protein [Rosenbergiella australiborealis]MBT0728114.1 DUF2496 domain-containing protein [Rosenbergiella australiborealis]
MSLESAPIETKLAIDLIMLLENHDLPAQVVLDALKIVQKDFQRKADQQVSPPLE